MRRRRTIGSPPRFFDSLIIFGRLSEGAGHLCGSATKLALSHTMRASISSAAQSLRTLSTKNLKASCHLLLPFLPATVIRGICKAVTWKTFILTVHLPQACHLRTCTLRERGYPHTIASKRSRRNRGQPIGAWGSECTASVWAGWGSADGAALLRVGHTACAVTGRGQSTPATVRPGSVGRSITLIKQIFVF